MGRSGFGYSEPATPDDCKAGVARLLDFGHQEWTETVGGPVKGALNEDGNQHRRLGDRLRCCYGLGLEEEGRKYLVRVPERYWV